MIEGNVTAADSKKPLSSVSVYLNNTSIGTTTNDKGFFTLRNIPSDKFKLIASSIGYETFTKLIDPKKISGRIVISLNPKPDQLNNIILVPDDPDAFRKWGKLFTDIFIGTNTNANQCHIENPEIIKLRMNTDNTLTAFAREPLRIMNYALGYEIIYKLEEFEYDMNRKVVTYNGYVFFKDLGSSHKKKGNKYDHERKESYRGSLMHFMRSYFINKLDEQGFEMRSLGNISNPEKDRAKYLFSLHKDSTILDTVKYEVIILPAGCQNCPPMIQKDIRALDSTDYFRKKLLGPDSVISHQIVLADSIGFAEDSATAGMYFKDSLEVSYKLKPVPGKYKALSKEHKQEIYPVSQFVFINKKPIYVSANGYYYGPHDLKITGFWAWWETISTMLPYDYS
ncbi:MAG TPA: carboxypeptidase-like regulatory domain-containing protein, partial [Candidatus Paceibacterota bacterium]|nr:carboxypeptidase-like regulatory domain-containing protein [Candidatus Paceibacterota bacterium]